MARSFYIAACAENGGVYHCHLAENGTLQVCDMLPLVRPMYLAYENGMLYVLLLDLPNGNGSALVTVPLHADGSFGAPSAPVPTQGQEACHLDVHNGTVYAVNYHSGNVIRMPNTVVTHTGHSVHTVRQTAPHTHFVKRTPNGNALFVADLGTDTVYTYDLQLNLLHTAQVPLGHGCRHLAYAENGKTVYCANELASTVSIFSNENGRLTLQDTVAALPPEFSGNSTIAAIRTFGNYVYVSNRGHDSITRFAVHENSLQLLECTPCGGCSPRDFDIFDDWLICTNEHGNNVTVFRLCDGKPIQQTDTLPLPRPLCVIAVD